MNELMKIGEFFLRYPHEEIHLRELARKLKISPYTVKKYCDKLVEEELIIDHRQAHLRVFKANNTNIYYKQVKITQNIREINQAGLVQEILEKLANISSITLYGSYAKGENTEQSDIDIVIIGKDKPFSIQSLPRVEAHVYSWSEWKQIARSNKAYYIDVIQYGIALFGDIPIIK